MGRGGEDKPLSEISTCNLCNDDGRALEDFDLYFNPRIFRIYGQVVGYADSVISPRLVETPEAFQILAKRDRIENIFRLPEQVRRTNLGEHLA